MVSAQSPRVLSLRERKRKEVRMSDREKDVPAGSDENVDPEDKKLSLDDLGVVYGGWHPAPPEDDPTLPDRGS